VSCHVGLVGREEGLSWSERVEGGSIFVVGKEAKRHKVSFLLVTITS